MAGSVNSCFKICLGIVQKKTLSFSSNPEKSASNPYRFPVKLSCWQQFPCQTPIVFQHFGKMHIFLPRGLPNPEVPLPSKSMIRAGM